MFSSTVSFATLAKYQVGSEVNAPERPENRREQIVCVHPEEPPTISSQLACYNLFVGSKKKESHEVMYLFFFLR